MNYELAKQLKDAGFPQEMKGGHWMLTAHGFEVAKGSEYLATDGLYLPTLEELMDECGDGFEGLERLPNNLWGAYSDTNVKPENSIGPTPKIAVVHLYLALNSKK